ncbi:cytochrome b [Parvularcula marina]|uniref:Cytochrome b n=1 Tax=Parvularcula marina TaxID=2292771 RepID=A0A371R7Q0_9PROT|nr:cytochrome b N-terminal domain-containing protein [Parvularcula marina]RFB01491.1 cytochrome b [Parvularcula marina]
MSHESNYVPGSGLERWLDKRLPIIRLGYDTGVDFPCPKNLNYWWTFGGILAVCLMVQIITGIVLAMHYVADSQLAFKSVEHIMRDVNYGWLIRYVHMNGASMFFLAVYLHIARGLYYGSYKEPREVLWMIGVLIFLLMMGTAFMGYVLPWGQMSFWGATVISGLVTALPIIGDPIHTLLLGGFTVDSPTLNRFFALHYLLPFVIAGLVILHIWALHIPGNSNPTGVEAQSKKDTVPFHPYYTVKDGFAIILFLILFAAFVYFNPNALGHPDNYIPADPLVTPAHIVPEWYFLPFYAMLRAINFNIGIPFTDIVLINSKLGGFLVMMGSILIWFILPWLDRSKVKSMRYRPIAKLWFFLLVIDFFILGWLGGKPAEQPFVFFSLVGTIYYFAYFLMILPILSVMETPTEMPKSISEAVLADKKKSGTGETPIASPSPAE